MNIVDPQPSITPDSNSNNHSSNNGVSRAASNDDHGDESNDTSSSSLPLDQNWRFSHLRPSTTVPTNHELASLLSSREVLEQSRRRLQDEVDQLLRLAESKQVQIKDKQSRIDLHSSLGSSLRRIPSDVLRDIFARTIPLLHVSLRNVCLDGPWPLLRVCKHWHNICLAYGSLWNRISIDTSLSHPLERPLPAAEGGHPLIHERPLYMRPTIPNDVQARTIELLELKISRSRDAGLYITIQARPPTDYAQPFLRTIWPHMHRCVYIKAPRHVLANTPLPRPCERLRQIDVDYSTGPGRFHSGPTTVHLPFPTETPHDIESFQAFLVGNQEPPTINISYHDVDRYSQMHPPFIPIPQSFAANRVTKINLVVSNMRPSDTFLPNLSLFANLVELSMIDRSPGQHTPGLLSQNTAGDTPRAIMPRLTQLAVSGTRLTQLTIDRIVAPSLIALSYVGPMEVGFDSLRDFISVSSCDLVRFFLTTNASDQDIAGFFQSIAHAWRTVEVVGIRHDTFDRDFTEVKNECAATIDLLTRPRDNAASSADIFPCLSFLELAGFYSDIHGVVDVLESRREEVYDPRSAVRLAGCRLTDLMSLHYKYSDAELRVIAAKIARVRTLQSERMASTWETHPLQSHGDDEYREIWDDFPPNEFYNPTLTWVERLDREPDQLARMNRLQNDGLEVWMRLRRLEDEFLLVAKPQ
ncbi:hypothetical protein BDV98DRAFT_297340 [Pterulicium gracile]|uniref:F-box domain-containing protein n=1 Tax=Pterulicium gracile TaxID=1884261 RepID=A0A5C3Q5V1_9AGAR|nr:hypothetical protein BDV98DRAFT_297340 [Pterula gracilis]